MGLQIHLNHQTQYFRVLVNGKTIGRFEILFTEQGQNGRWYIFTGPDGQGPKFVLERPS